VYQRFNKDQFGYSFFTNIEAPFGNIRWVPDCVAKLPLMRIANHDSVGGDGIGGSGA